MKKKYKITLISIIIFVGIVIAVFQYAQFQYGRINFSLYIPISVRTYSNVTRDGIWDPFYYIIHFSKSADNLILHAKNDCRLASVPIESIDIRVRAQRGLIGEVIYVGFYEATAEAAGYGAEDISISDWNLERDGERYIMLTILDQTVCVADSIQIEAFLTELDSLVDKGYILKGRWVTG